MSTFETINPTTEETLATHEQMTAAELKAAIESCHVAFLRWRQRPVAERAKVVAGIGEALSDRKADLAAQMTAEMGKLVAHGEREVDLCAAICAWTAENAAEHLADEERSLSEDGRGIITYQPIGLVYGIQPWNFPVYQVIRYAIASLVAGNGVLLKHAHVCFGSAKLLEEVFEQGGLPKHLFTPLFIDHDQSDEVIAHDAVRGVTFTGSVGGGRAVATQAAKHLKKTVLELGSNDAYMVLSDADIDGAVEACVKGRIFNNGEVCVAAKRFVVVDSVYDTFERKFVAAMSDISFGDPTDEGVKMGPMVRQEMRDQLHEQVQESVKKGARVRCGGEVPDRIGFFYPATVLVDVAPGQPAYEDELFGPVASVIRATDDDDAMRIANDSPFGLGGGIFSADADAAVKRAREQFDTGMVFINGVGLADPQMPFGGVKQSGYGREHGGFGMREFVNTKSVMVQ